VNAAWLIASPSRPDESGVRRDQRLVPPVSRHHDRRRNSATDGDSHGIGTCAGIADDRAKAPGNPRV